MGVVEGSGMKAEEAEEAESSDGEDLETSSGAGGADQSVWYIICFANEVKLYQRKTCNCFGCGSPDHHATDFQRILARPPKKQV